MDKLKASADMIAHALPLLPFEGWSQATLAKAAVQAGYKKTDVIRVFPGGAIDAVEAFMRDSDTQFLKELEHYHLDSMKIRDRIATAVRVRINIHANHREALRKTLAFLALPFYCHRAVRCLYRTVDNVWYAAGDTSTDFNFYTKRLILAGVYSTTLLFWLDDKSPDSSATWEFLGRRIANVMAFEKAKHQFRNWYGQKTATL